MKHDSSILQFLMPSNTLKNASFAISYATKCNICLQIPMDIKLVQHWSSNNHQKLLATVKINILKILPIFAVISDEFRAPIELRHICGIQLAIGEPPPPCFAIIATLQDSQRHWRRTHSHSTILDSSAMKSYIGGFPSFSQISDLLISMVADIFRTKRM